MSDELAPNEILVAKDTEFERRITLQLPRGKFARGKTPQLIESLSGLDGFAADGSASVSDVGKALKHLLDTKGFLTRLFPLALGLTDRTTGAINKKDKVWVEEDITDMDIFHAYVQAVGFIADNGDITKEVAAASKKLPTGAKETSK